MKNLYKILMILCFVITATCAVMFWGGMLYLQFNSSWALTRFQLIAETWYWFAGLIISALLGLLFNHLNNKNDDHA